ncbi:unnamed protein product, partial [Symbiodinium pilosum]
NCGHCSSTAIGAGCALMDPAVARPTGRATGDLQRRSEAAVQPLWCWADACGEPEGAMQTERWLECTEKFL